MNAQQKEDFANAILLTLEANSSRFGLAPEAIMIHIRSRGFTPTRDEVLDMLAYLESESRGYVEQVEKTIGKANPVWRITAEGTQYLDEHGL